MKGVWILLPSSTTNKLTFNENSSQRNYKLSKMACEKKKKVPEQHKKKYDLRVYWSRQSRSTTKAALKVKI